MAQLGTKLGGWVINPSIDSKLPEPLATFISEKRLGAETTVLAFLAEQIVSGKNYMLLCEVTLATHPVVKTLSKVVVNLDLTGNFTIVSNEALYQLDIPGGLTLKFNFDGVEQKVATAFVDLLNPLLGAEYDFVAYVGSQVVHGTNHLFLAKQKLVTLGQEEHLVFVVLTELKQPDNPDSKFAVRSVDVLV